MVRSKLSRGRFVDHNVQEAWHGATRQKRKRCVKKIGNLLKMPI